jgi:uncharacterized protein YegJ (DUF2314 family)
MHQGSPVTVEPERISDWAMASPHGLYGAYTMRVIVQDLPQAEAQQYRSMLATTPLPAAWTQ